MEYAWWRDLFLVIEVVRFGLVMGVETCGGGVTCERSAERRRHLPRYKKGRR